MARPLPGMVPKTAAESRRRTATASWLPAAGLAFLVTAVSASWALRDNVSPQWDQGHYLFLSWVYQQALDHHGPIALIRAVYTADPSRAPLLSLLVLPLSYLFGPGPGAGLALNVLLWPVLLLSAGAVAKSSSASRPASRPWSSSRRCRCWRGPRPPSSKTSCSSRWSLSAPGS